MSKVALFALLLMTFSTSPGLWAVDLYDLEMGLPSDSDESQLGDDNQDEEVPHCWQSPRCCYVPKKCISGLKVAKNFVMDVLGTPEGATALAVGYGVAQGISNFLWAFNWVEHAGASPETAAIIQEIGGLSASAECFALGAIVPLMLYVYKVRHPSANNADGDDEPDDAEKQTFWQNVRTRLCPDKNQADDAP